MTRRLGPGLLGVAHGVVVAAVSIAADLPPLWWFGLLALGLGAGRCVLVLADERPTRWWAALGGVGALGLVVVGLAVPGRLPLPQPGWTVEGNDLTLGPRSGEVVVLGHDVRSLRDGERRWSFPGRVVAAAAGTLYVLDRNRLTARRASDGRERWTTLLDLASADVAEQGDAVLGEGRIAVGSSVLNITDGRLEWQLPGAHLTAGVVDGRALQGPRAADYLVALPRPERRGAGLSVFSFAGGAARFTVPVSAGGVVVGSSLLTRDEDGASLARDLSTGAVVWDRGPILSVSALTSIRSTDRQVEVVGSDGRGEALLDLATGVAEPPTLPRGWSRFEGVGDDWLLLGSGRRLALWRGDDQAPRELGDGEGARVATSPTTAVAVVDQRDPFGQPRTRIVAVGPGGTTSYTRRGAADDVGVAVGDGVLVVTGVDETRVVDLSR